MGSPADLATDDCLPIYNPTHWEVPDTDQESWEEIFNQIEAGWKTLLAVSSTAVLGCASFNLNEIS